MIEKLFLMSFLERAPRAVSHLYCIVLFFFGWLLFSVTGLHNVFEWFIGMFGAYGFTGQSTIWELQSWSYVALIPIFVIASLPWAPYLRKKLEAWGAGKSNGGGLRIVAAPEKGNSFAPPCMIEITDDMDAARRKALLLVNTLVDLTLLGIFVLSCMSVASSSYNPFIYFQF